MTIDSTPAPEDHGILTFLRHVASTRSEPMPAAPSSTLRRAATAAVALGTAAAMAAILLSAVGAALPDVPFTWREFGASTGWYLGYVLRAILGVVVVRSQADNAAAAWFGVLIGLELVGEFLGTLPAVLSDVGAAPIAIAGVTLAEASLAGVLAVVALQLFARLPAGGVEDRVRRWVHASWLVVVVPPLAFTTLPLVPVPWWVGDAVLDNPFQLAWTAPAATALAALESVVGGLYFVGFGLLVARYVRSGQVTRRRLRWMFGVPIISVALLLTIGLFPDMPLTVLSLITAAAFVAIPVFTALTVLGPDRIDVDRVLRRSIVYGVMWIAIAGLYVAVGASVGTAAGRRLPAFGAAVLTVIATLAFQPVRRWLEQHADRWVFGNRTDPAHLVADLGAALASTYDLDELLPTIESTLERGLSVEWARVQLDGARGRSASRDRLSAEAALQVPIVLGEAHLGIIECGPRRGRPLGAADEAVVRTFARQAALALANVRLTTELTSQAAQLTESRARLVQAQEAERRRIERNIHDGVQQELVSVIQRAGEIEGAHASGVDVEAELTELRRDLARLLVTLRELAAGIHPSLLTDRGLLPAVEALAARHPVPVTVRVDRSLRGRRFDEAVEGAAYFTVAESLANSLKHATADHVDITLGQRNGSILLEVRDDGVGFSPDGTVPGHGLTNLAARVEALGGGLTVESQPGGGTAVTATLSLVTSTDRSS